MILFDIEIFETLSSNVKTNSLFPNERNEEVNFGLKIGGCGVERNF